MKSNLCAKPHCRRIAEYYGKIGGYGKLCKLHAEEKATKQRAAAKRRRERIQ
jgi:hypothetical protein